MTISRAVDGLVEEEQLARKLKMYLMKRYSGATLKVIGEPFGLEESAVSQVSRRFDSLASDDKTAQKMLNLC